MGTGEDLKRTSELLIENKWYITEMNFTELVKYNWEHMPPERKQAFEAWYETWEGKRTDGCINRF